MVEVGKFRGNDEMPQHEISFNALTRCSMEVREHRHLKGLGHRW